jgi:multidrug efflux pump
MTLSDLSVKRPVFAVTLSLLITTLGVMSFLRLPLREIPNIDPPVVSVETSYRGASSAVVESRITQILEDAVAGIEGIELIQSSSQNGRSSVTVEFDLGREIDSAANDVRDAVSRARGLLPPEADPPQVAKVDGDADVMMWLNFSSSRMNNLELTEYADQVLVDRFSAAPGVARINLGGGQRYAMRVWLKREELAARGLTVSDVLNSLRRENVELPAGRIESVDRDFTVRVPRSYASADDFSALSLIKGRDGHVVRLGEVAMVELGSAERRTYFTGNGEPQVGLGVIKQSTANALDVARAVRAIVADLQNELPEGANLLVAVDTSEFIDAAVNEVYFTLGLTIVLVVVVIYLFLGSWRAALIPAVTVPVCIVASFIALDAAGFSLNLITLLALILSIGLVVDDAIVVLENCQRRIDEEKESALVASYRGASQVGFAVIATTVVLIAVFVPIAFMEGNLGRLFRELAAAIAFAMFISSVVALSLSPMMCSLMLKSGAGHTGLAAKVDALSARLTRAYRRALEREVERPLRYVVLMLACIVGIVALARVVPTELAPAEDRGVFFVPLRGPEGAGFDYTLKHMQDVEQRLVKMVEEDKIKRVNIRAPQGFGGSSTEEMHTGQAIVVMKPWNERTLSTDQTIAEVQRELLNVTGLVGQPQMRQGFGRGFGQPLQFVIMGPDYNTLAGWRDQLIPKLAQNPKLLNVDSDYRETRPQLRVQIDRARAADLSVSVDEIASALDVMLGSRRITTFLYNGEEYDVLVQAERSDRATPTDLQNLYVRSRSNELIPLSNLVSVSELAEAGSFNRMNRQRAITISARPAPDYTLGDAMAFVEAQAREVLPNTARFDYRGDARELKKTGTNVLLTFALALLVVYLVLAAQFESFLHPLIIMLTVPLAIFGALLGLLMFGSTLNLYSQIGVVILIGLAAKNGILIVEFATQLRDQGREIRDAIIEASSLRLRPILMTSVCTAVGALPLLMVSGAGAHSRFTIGVVIFTGVVLSTLLSLFVVPALYRALAKYTRSPETTARALAEAERQAPSSRLVTE